MAKLGVSFTVFFFAFVLANGRSPAKSPKNNIAQALLHSGTTKVAKNPIILPSEKPELSETERSEPKANSSEDVEEAGSGDLRTRPFTGVKLHPVRHHHSPRKPLTPSYHPGHPLRRRRRHHHHQSHHHQSRRHHFKHHVPHDTYNDMVVSSNDMSFDSMFGGDVHQIPSRWMRLPQPKPRSRYPFSRGRVVKNNRRQNHWAQKDKKSGIVRRILKFLNQI